MNRRYLHMVLMGCLIGTWGLSIQAQTPRVVERGEELTLQAPEGLTHCQWQVSTDLQYFTDIPMGDTATLCLKAYGPGYYRVKATDAQGKAVVADTTQVELTRVHYAAKHSVSGGAHGYAETIDGKPDARGLWVPEDRHEAIVDTVKVLSHWTDGRTMAVYYLHHPKDTVDTEMFIRIKKDAEVALHVRVCDPEDKGTTLAEHTVAVRGTGDTQRIPLVGLTLPTSKYYRYELQCLKGWDDIIEITRYYHYSHSGKETYKPSYLSSPSVHLGSWTSTMPGAPKGANYDWCYLEVMMPKAADLPGTYIMSLGVLSGYMGIQMNGWYDDGTPRHNVIFSMWDAGNTDLDPNLPDNFRANVVDYGEGVDTERFGNEGTGMKTFKQGNNWSCDTYVQFITNCRPEVTTYKVVENGKEVTKKQRNMLVSAWYNAQDGQGWQYMATLRLPQSDVYFESWYSFLENYNAGSGQAQRLGYYRNGYARAKGSKQWYHFNKVNFSHTDGGTHKGARYDYGMGTSERGDGSFFMSNGGYLATKVTANQTLLNQTNTPVDTISLDALYARIDSAVAKEQRKIAETEAFRQRLLDISDWRVARFTSEENGCEGPNGKASMIIDGDTKTYWHSGYGRGVAQFPHELTVDMKKINVMDGFQITMSGGDIRYIKGLEVYVAERYGKWRKVYANDSIERQEVFRFFLDEPARGRFFKLRITDGYGHDGPFVRINEVEVTGYDPETAVTPITADKGTFVMSMGTDALQVYPTAYTDELQLALYRMDGTLVATQEYHHTAEGTAVVFSMKGIERGMYLMRYQSGENSCSGKVIWNR